MTQAALKEPPSTKLCRMAGCAAVMSLGLLGVSPSWADNCTGYDVLFTESAETTDLGQGTKQLTVRQHSVLLSNDSIYNLVAGECSGIVLQTQDGKTQASGYCARRDKEGQTQSISWHQAPGADRGEWKSTGGTGKFAGKQDSGWFQPVTTLPEGKISVTKWGGNCH
jgi:hypothetical protein